MANDYIIEMDRRLFRLYLRVRIHNKKTNRSNLNRKSFYLLSFVKVSLLLTHIVLDKSTVLFKH